MFQKPKSTIPVKLKKPTLSLLLAFLFIISCGLYNTSNKPHIRTAERYLKAILTNDLALYKEVADNEALEQYKETVNLLNLAEDKTLGDYRLVNDTIINQSTAWVVFSHKKDKEDVRHIRLVKVANSWRYSRYSDSIVCPQF